ncbi:MAG: flagellar basal body rod protein FlgC [bacterium]|jgi:flagellar basal-body rod protein FlgC
MSFLNSLNASVSGMTAQRQRINTISENIANAQTTRTPEGGPYRRREVVMAAVANDRTFEEELRAQDRSPSTTTEVKVVGITQDSRPPILRYEPGHPDANEEGYVAMPNINVMEEMVNMMMASRAYEANTAAFNASKKMAEAALDLGRG